VAQVVVVVEVVFLKLGELALQIKVLTVEAALLLLLAVVVLLVVVETQV
jgi:hypothetical protein